MLEPETGTAVPERNVLEVTVVCSDRLGVDEIFGAAVSVDLSGSACSTGLSSALAPSESVPSPTVVSAPPEFFCGKVETSTRSNDSAADKGSDDKDDEDTEGVDEGEETNDEDNADEDGVGGEDGVGVGDGDGTGID